jgi:hypothetical protein
MKRGMTELREVFESFSFPAKAGIQSRMRYI